jgi:hypothetical protein
MGMVYGWLRNSQEVPMADAESGQRFPFINLEKAIGRANELYSADQRGGEMSVASAFAVWKYSEKSSGGHQTVAALKAYGLLGAPQSGKVQLSKEALAYFRDEREDERAKLAQSFAISPPLLKSLWSVWGEQPPADTLARSHLKVDRGLSEQSARAVLGIYKENIAFANLKGGDKIVEPEGDDTGGENPNSVKVGDYVQWTSNGVDQFKPPRKVKNIVGRHAFVHGSGTGISMSELTIVPAPAPAPVGEGKPLGANKADDGNEISVLLASNRLQITADVDDKGLEKLEQMLKAYKDILKMLQ